MEVVFLQPFTGVLISSFWPQSTFIPFLQCSVKEKGGGVGGGAQIFSVFDP